MKSCLVAIVVPEEAQAKAWCAANGKADACSDPAFKKLVMDDMARLAAENKLNGLERPKDIFLTLDLFSVENDILTPTFKLKRNVARKAY